MQYLSFKANRGRGFHESLHGHRTRDPWSALVGPREPYLRCSPATYESIEVVAGGVEHRRPVPEVGWLQTSGAREHNRA